MKEILLGLVTLIGTILGTMLLAFVLGCIGTFVKNTFTNEYSPWRYRNIMTKGGYGLLVIVLIMCISALCWIIGFSILQ